MPVEMKLTTRIIINGKEYASVDQMPADVRRLYEEAVRHAGPVLADANRNDVFDVAKWKVKSRIIFNGREYGSAEELPPDVHRAYSEAMTNQQAPANLSASGGMVTVPAGPFGPASGSAVGRIVMRLAVAGLAALLLWWLVRSFELGG